MGLDSEGDLSDATRTLVIVTCAGVPERAFPVRFSPQIRWASARPSLPWHVVAPVIPCFGARGFGYVRLGRRLAVSDRSIV